MPVAPVTTFASGADLGVVLTQAWRDDVDRAPSDDERRVLTLAGEFLFHRFGGGSAAAYRAWRVASGYRPRDAASKRAAGALDDHRRFVARDSRGQDPASLPVERMFDDLWGALRATSIGQASGIIGVATGAPAVALAMGEADAKHPGEGPVLQGGWPADLWRGAVQGGARGWWTDPQGGMRKHLAERGTVPVARVGVLVETRSAGRFPLVLSYYKAPDGRWWLWRVNIHNVDPATILQIDY